MIECLVGHGLGEISRLIDVLFSNCANFDNHKANCHSSPSQIEKD